MYTSTDIKTKINEIRYHYDTYLNNKFVKSIMMKLDIPHTIHRDMDYILTNEIIYIDSKGSLMDLYAGIKAIIFLIKDIDIKITPNIQGYMDAGKKAYSANDAILYQMAIKNYPMNVVILETMIKQLYDMVLDFDRSSFAGHEIFKSVKDIKDIDIYFQSRDFKNNLSKS